MPKTLETHIQTFHTKYTIMPNGCWEWIKSKDGYGYGLIRINKKTILAHRFSAKYLANQNIDNLHVCHHCDNPSCVNPNHLFVGTHKDNMDDMNRKGRNPSLKSCHTPLGNFPSKIAAAKAHNCDTSLINYRMKKYPKEYYFL